MICQHLHVGIWPHFAKAGHGDLHHSAVACIEETVIAGLDKNFHRTVGNIDLIVGV